MVNDAWHECLKPEDAGKLVDDLRARGEAALSGCHHVVERKTSMTVTRMTGHERCRAFVLSYREARRL